MGAWYAAAGVLLGYNALAARRGTPHACQSVRNLTPEDKTMAVLVWLWLGIHVFRDKADRDVSG